VLALAIGAAPIAMVAAAAHNNGVR